MDYACKWCHEIKPEEEFIKRDRKAPYSEGNIRCCRSCNQARNRERYKVPEIREKQLAANAQWRKDHPERQRELEAAFNQRTPRNQKARSKVGYMIRHGYWTQQPCEVCGEPMGVEAHHDSYAEAHWTTVRWLCKLHHEVWHQHLDPLKGPILEEPMAEVARLRDEHDAVQHQMADLRRKAQALKKQADDLEFDVWSKVQKIAMDLFPKVFKKQH
jgi:hypothetical protein